MKTLGIIPARYASTRFPGKPLVDINGKSMIQRVYEQASKCAKLDQVIVATDDVRIADEVIRFGGRFQYTSTTHQSGTDRCAEAAKMHPDFDIIINIQGDEPFIDPEQIDLLISCFDDPQVQLATLIKEIYSEAELFNQNQPKVVVNAMQQAIYFSRETIPFLRGLDKTSWLKAHQFYKHIGIYGYSRAALLEITRLAPSLLEKAESLEQLRWIENGFKIHTAVTSIETLAIDTPEDLKKILPAEDN
ncbi:MAG: 3-deoxy-manno-octulosonate cytidylyltransferase [Pedobacter sp.]|nr:3-deoxy-manno-octulosonate cytidylyltransferase [Pedobacter sp.]